MADIIGIPERGRTLDTIDVPFGITEEEVMDIYGYSEEEAAILVEGTRHDDLCQCEICQRWWALAPDDWFEATE